MEGTRELQFFACLILVNFLSPAQPYLLCIYIGYDNMIQFWEKIIRLPLIQICTYWQGVCTRWMAERPPWFRCKYPTHAPAVARLWYWAENQYWKNLLGYYPDKLVSSMYTCAIISIKWLNYAMRLWDYYRRSAAAMIAFKYSSSSIIGATEDVLNHYAATIHPVGLGGALRVETDV